MVFTEKDEELLVLATKQATWKDIAEPIKGAILEKRPINSVNIPKELPNNSDDQNT